MTTCDPKPQLPPVFTSRQQALIEQIFSTKISELIASGGLVCSHCSSNSQLPLLPADSKVSVPTTPFQKPATSLQQLIDNRSDIGPNTSSTSTNSVAANLSTSAHLIGKLASVDKRLTHLECRFTKFESSVVQSSNFNPENKHVDSTRLLEEMHAKFETTMSKLQSALQQTVHQQRLESTDYEQPAVQSRSASSSNVVLEQSDVNNMKALHSVAVDRREVLDTLVLNIGHEHNELAEFVGQLSQCTASADDVVELKAIVGCMARVTGVSEHKAEQLITQFIGRESEELEHLKRELRLADDKIRQLQLANEQMAEMYDSPYQNQIPYLILVSETMRSECKRYKRDLNAISKRLSERVNAKVAQAIQQSLVDRHQQNKKKQSSLLSTEDLNIIPPRPPRLSVSAYLSGKISRPTVLDTGACAEQLTDSDYENYSEIVPQRPTFNQSSNEVLSVINCLIVGHESAQTHRLVQAYVSKMSGKSVTHVGDKVSVNVRVRDGEEVVCTLSLDNCSKSGKLMSINVCDIIVICFSVINETSFGDVQNVWLKQIRQVYPDVPYLLVGTRTDMRREQGIRIFQVEFEQGFELSQKIEAVEYLECSDFEVNDFETVIMHALQYVVW